ncbi:hypothetical protein D3C75_809180 [compost metagenome]
MVATPNTPTAVNIVRPTLRWNGKRASQSDISNAPTAGAERNRPRPIGPVSRMSLANTGSNAVAPPNNTANRSSEMAPRMSGRLRMKRMPASSDSMLARPRWATWPRACRLRVSTQAMAYRATVGPYTQMLPKAYRKPPTAGATMVADWVAEAEAATARGNSPAGTTLGSSAWVAGISNERVAPSRKARAKISSRVTLSVALPSASASAISPCRLWHSAATLRRS